MMKESRSRPAWTGWAFLLWTLIVLAVYVRQLFANAALLAIKGLW